MKASRIGVLLLVLGLVFTTGCLSFFQKEYTISGNVVGPEGNPLVGVEIIISGGTSATTETDESGNWSAKVKGKVTITPKHKQYEFEPENVEINKQKSNIDFSAKELAPYSLSGTVLDAEGQPIPASTVAISGRADITIPVAADGTWSASDLMGTINVTAIAPGYVFESATATNETEKVDLVGTNNFLLWYKFDQEDGTIVTDHSPNEFHGTLVGGTSYTSGIAGNAVSLDGIDGYVDIPDHFFMDEAKLSIAVWVNQKEQREWSRIFDLAGEFGFVYMTPLADHLLLTLFAHDTSVVGEAVATDLRTDPLPIDEWVHIVAVFDEKTISLYVNGEHRISEDAPMNVNDMGPTFHNYIGESIFEDPCFYGDFDEFRVYKEALSADDVAAIFDGYQ